MLDHHAATIDRLRSRLAAEHRPGEAAFGPMGVPGRTAKTVVEARRGGAREGAVLILVYPKQDVPHVILTERRADLRDHAGQVSLPGGRIEPHESPLAAALRETSEEVGLGDGVTVLGPLSPLWIPPTNFLVFPFVAATDARQSFTAASGEVAALVEAPLSALADPRSRVTALRTGLDGRPRTVPAFHVDGHEIWGATAMILAELLALLADDG